MENITFVNKLVLDKCWQGKINSDFLVRQIVKFIKEHQVFAGKKVSLFFTKHNFSSVVAVLRISEGGFVLKVPLHKRRLQGEVYFLNQYRKAGVKVPVILEEGFIGAKPYILMEYISADTVSNLFCAEEIYKRGLFYQAGLLLRKMHNVYSKGYGKIVNGRPEHNSFDSWVSSHYFKSRVRYVRGRNLIDDKKHGHLVEAIQIMMSLCKKDKKTAFCHNDFSIHNILFTKPLTVIDPNPRMNNRYFDIAQAIEYLVLNHYNPKRFIKQFIEGYFQKGKVDFAALRSAMLINSYLKIHHWHKIGKTKRIKLLTTFLEQNKEKPYW